MMKQTGKRLFALCVALVLAFSLSASAFAAEVEEDPSSEETYATEATEEEPTPEDTSAQAGEDEETAGAQEDAPPAEEPAEPDVAARETPVNTPAAQPPEKAEEALAGMAPAAGDTASSEDMGDFHIAYTTGDCTYRFGKKVITLVENGTYTISMKNGVTESTTNRIVVGSGVEARLILNGVNINISGIDDACALDLSQAGASIVSLAAGSENTLKSGKNMPGLQAPATSKLTINGTGSLEVYGGANGAGIGRFDETGDIEIQNGTVKATGGSSGAGIGGNKSSAGGTVTISGGTVTAAGGSSGAGIGGNKSSAGGTVIISGGTVTATGGSGGAGIGGGDQGAGGTTTISGGTVTAKGSAGGAGIGGGNKGTGGAITITGGSVKARQDGTVPSMGPGSSGSGATITISGGSVEASGAITGTFSTGTGGCAVIRAGTITDITDSASWSGLFFQDDEYQMHGSPLTFGADATFPADGTLRIKTGEVLTISSGVTLRNDGIIVNAGTINGTGTLENNGKIIDNGIITATVTGKGLNPKTDFTVTGTADTDYQYDHADLTLTILTDKALTISGSSKAETIKVASGVSANLTLDGLDIDVSSRNGTCALDMSSAGTSVLTLATGSENSLKSGKNMPGICVPDASKLTIKGTGSLAAYGGASGVGIGRSDGAGNVEIQNGSVKAQGGSSAAGINVAGGSITISGGMVDTNGTISGTFSTGDGGCAVIRTGGISDTSGSGSWSGLFFVNGIGQIYGGSQALRTDMTISASEKLTVRANKTLTIGNGVTLNNNGTIMNGGTIAGGGTLVNNGKITNVGDITVTVTGNAPIQGRDFTVTGGKANTDYVYDIDPQSQAITMTILSNKALTISGTSVSIPIKVKSGVSANLTLNGLNIDLPSTRNASALDLGQAGTSIVTLAAGSENTLKNDNYDQLGIQMPAGKKLTLNGTGSLKVSGFMAGIGRTDNTGIIEIQSGTITATSGDGAGIGGGNRFGYGTITITGGTVTATGGSFGAGIGGGRYFELYGGLSGSAVTITGGTVKATGGYYGAGIGGGSDRSTCYGQAGGTISISGGTVTAASNFGAGIGGGGADSETAGAGGNINISGGTVTATSGIGAGIGGGSVNNGDFGGVGGNVTISGGTVRATSSTVAGIGGGCRFLYGGGHAGNGSFSATGNAYILASAIGDTSSSANWRGVIFQGTSGEVYGSSVTLKTDATIPESNTLVIDTNKTLVVDSGTTLTNDGTLTVTGTFSNRGTFVNNGTFNKNGIFEKSTPKAADFKVSPSLPATRTYTGKAQGVTVTPIKVGVGTITVFYEGTGGTAYSKSTTPPKNIGKYLVTVNATGDDYNCNAVSGLSLGTLAIAKPPVSQITLSKSNVTLKAGSTASLTATVKPDSASKALKWTSSKTGVATVNSGKVTGKAAGQTVITAAATDGSKAKATCKVTVYRPLKSASMNVAAKTLKKGKTFTFKVNCSPSNATLSSVQWKSSKKAVAAVNSKTGKVTAKKKGTATISATIATPDGKKKTVKATLKVGGVAVKKVTLNKKSATVKKGKTVTLQAKVTPKNASFKGITWTSSKSKIATVTAKGVVKGVGKGKATITAKTLDGNKKATATIKVK